MKILTICLLISFFLLGSESYAFDDIFATQEGVVGGFTSFFIL